MPFARGAPPRAATAVGAALAPNGCAILLTLFRVAAAFLLRRSLLFVRFGPARMQARLASAWMPIRARRSRRSRLHEGEAVISAKPGFRRALPRDLRGCRVGGAAGAFARDSPAASERCEPVRLGGRAWDSQGGVPLGRGHGARSPMRDAAPFGGLSRRKGQAALRSRRKRAGNQWREGCRGPGCPGARGRVPRSRGAAASWEHREGGAAGCGPSGLRGSAATRWTPRTSLAC